MKPEEKLSRALDLIAKEEGELAGWTEFDENMSYLCWLDDQELVNEFLVLNEVYRLPDEIFESATEIAENFKGNETLGFNERYVLEYAIASIFMPPNQGLAAK